MSDTAKKQNDNGLSPLPMSLLPLLILFVAALTLFWLSGDGGDTFKYWEMFLYVVAVVSVMSGWTQAYVGGNNRLWYLLRQLVTWGGLIGLIYIINTQGYRELLNDTQYTGLIVYLVALGALIAAIQMDIKLAFFATFLVYCAYVISVPENNPTLIGVGNVFKIADPQTKPLLVTGVFALVCFGASIVAVLMMRGAVITKNASKKRRK